ncbi:MAG: hypothetical protein M1835_005343 [Candelina submexicana]|nr:MAG: hypothetical protein M1835_005343 [Candelina submexicana]
MAQRYAKNQTLGFPNRIERVAVVGAGGGVGKYITKELLETGKHTITVLTRPDSQNRIPEGVKVAHIDYDDESTLITALQGQQFLIITLSVTAPPDTHSKLVQAAAKAGVPYVMPNGWGLDVENKSLVKEAILGDKVVADIDEIAKIGASSWIALVCNMWYEYSLAAGPEWFGFDFKEKKLTLYDDGNTKINVTTWEQCGRAVAAYLNLKELPEDENDQSPTISTWRNKPLYISSFLLNQKDMFESWKRVSGDKDSDWTIDSEPSAERNKRGLEILRTTGDRKGLGLAAFSRIFFPNGGGDYESKLGLANDVLGLPKEDLDERTRFAKEMVDDGYSPFDRRGY